MFKKHKKNILNQPKAQGAKKRHFHLGLFVLLGG